MGVLHPVRGIPTDRSETTPSIPLATRDHTTRLRRHRPWRPPASSDQRHKAERSRFALYVTVLLPFAAGYYLSWVTYTMNALIADQLARELALSPSELGLVTASYLLGMAMAQIPLGSLTDRYGPRLVQSICCLIAAAGAIVFAAANGLPVLLLGRILLGVGAATAFTAGANAIALRFPAQRAAFAMGLFVSLGSLGAVTATLPAQVLVDTFGWRTVFVLLAVLSVLCAALTYAVVPDDKADRPKEQPTDEDGYGAILGDRRFWKLAPVSATCIGTAWSLHSLWAAPWLSEVEGYDHTSVVHVLLAMAVSLSLASLAFGIIARSVQRKGIGLETLFGVVLLLLLAAQAVLVLRLPINVALPWMVIGAIGSATVVSYSILATYVPRHRLGQANAALNLVHLLVAFAVQALIGLVIDFSPVSGGACQPANYQRAFAIIVAVESAAFAWFVIPTKWTSRVWSRSRQVPPGVLGSHPQATQESRYLAARLDWNWRMADADTQLQAWRMAALASVTVLFVLATLILPIGTARSLLNAPRLAPDLSDYSVR